MEATVPEPIDLMQVTKRAICSLPMEIWLWLKHEADRRNTDASALIADMVRQEQAKPRPSSST